MPTATATQTGAYHQKSFLFPLPPSLPSGRIRCPTGHLVTLWNNKKVVYKEPVTTTTHQKKGRFKVEGRNFSKISFLALKISVGVWTANIWESVGRCPDILGRSFLLLSVSIIGRRGVGWGPKAGVCVFYSHIFFILQILTLLHYHDGWGREKNISCEAEFY